MRATRAASEEELVEQTRVRLDEMLAAGTTTAEVKSGYGLDVETEMKMLRALRTVGASHSLDLAPTFMGAHEIPLEYRPRLLGYLSYDPAKKALSRFDSGKVKTLVATDVAARGLDVDDITHVINFDPPEEPDVYTHRVGRTGRAGRGGIGITLVLPEQQVRALQASLRDKPGTRVRIDLKEQTVQGPGLQATFTVDSLSRDCLLRGIDEIDYTLSQLASIEDHERKNPT